MAIMIERVLAATDFSQAGQHAVNVAAEWARDTGAALRIVHVTPPKRWLAGAWGQKEPAIDAIHRHAANALKKAAELADPQRAVELSTGVLSGPAARSVSAAAREFRASLIVVGARGERDAEGEPVLGGTSSKLLAAAEAPLLLVRRARKDPVAGVVAALDLSPHSQTVLEWADLAAGGRHLHAYHVYDVPFAARLEAYGLAATAIDVYGEQARAQRDADLAALVAGIPRTGVTSRAVERGEPAARIRRYVDSVRPSLVVLGKHGRNKARSSGAGNIGRLVASSVAADVLIV